jgi:hypothetical protein
MTFSISKPAIALAATITAFTVLSAMHGTLRAAPDDVCGKASAADCEVIKPVTASWNRFVAALKANNREAAINAVHPHFQERLKENFPPDADLPQFARSVQDFGVTDITPNFVQAVVVFGGKKKADRSAFYIMFCRLPDKQWALCNM